VVPLEPGFAQRAAYCGRTIATTLKTYCGSRKISIADGIEQTFITGSYKLMKTPSALSLAAK
jgi:hypothetical protein